MRRITAVLYLITLHYFTYSQDSTALHYSRIIQPDKIRDHLEVLASDSLEGRETSTPGMIKAANYVASEFASYKLPPLANGTYFQEFPLKNFIAGLMTIDTHNKNYKYGQDFYATQGPAELSIDVKEIVFAGFGIEDSISKWDDYNGLDVNGKVLMILDGEPVSKKGIYVLTNSKETGGWKENRQRKITLAKSKNPRAIIFVNEDFKAAYERVSSWLTSGRLSLDDDELKKSVPVVYITESMANDFLQHSGFSTESYKQKAAKKKKPLNFLINSNIIISNKSNSTSCRNVLGFIEGSDLKDEIVIISAHLDHLGKKGDKIYYGADDDGSGSASALNIAEAFSKAKADGKGPRRSILVMTFSGEEKGLLGSEYYVTHPVFPLKNTVADLNIDMIGRVDTMHSTNFRYTYIIGSDKLSTELHSINIKSNENCCKLALDYTYNDPSDKLKLYYRSDHYNFAKNNIPVIFYFAGLHEDYHKPTDTIDKINFEKTATVARLVFNTAWELANRDKRITVDVVNDFK
jgi:hypothetical protein